MDPNASSSVPNAAPLPLAKLKHCASFAGTFATTWHWHSASPEFLICSKCFGDKIHGTRFEGAFLSSNLDEDGTQRICRFSRPRMKDYLWPQALASGSLQPAVDWMMLRPQIPPCLEINGVKGGEGQTWYRVKSALSQDDSIEGFVVCRACFEDIVLSNPFTADKMELVPWQVLSSRQAKESHWACDLAVPYIARQLIEAGKKGDWRSFATEARARLNIGQCPRMQAGPTLSRSWFVPKDTKLEAAGLLICVACYCDYVHDTSEDNMWRQATELAGIEGEVRCALGQPAMKLCIGRCDQDDILDHSIFWRAVNKFTAVTHPVNEPPPFQQDLCKSQAQAAKDDEWYTLHSQPEGFAVCRSCYLLMIEPFDLGHCFRRKTDIERGEAILCCLNIAHPRWPGYFTRFLEGYIKGEISSLESFASVWAKISPCQRAEGAQTNANWYGWPDCSICRECFHTFASKYPSMVSAMPWRDLKVGDPMMCDMYSPRMRRLFEQAATASSPDVTTLLDFARNRSQVWAQTMPRVNHLISQYQQAMARKSNMHTAASMAIIQAQTNHTLWGGGLYGNVYSAGNLITANGFEQQAASSGSWADNLINEARILEQKWKAVE